LSQSTAACGFCYLGLQDISSERWSMHHDERYNGSQYSVHVLRFSARCRIWRPEATDQLQSSKHLRPVGLTPVKYPTESANLTFNQANRSTYPSVNFTLTFSVKTTGNELSRTLHRIIIMLNAVRVVCNFIRTVIYISDLNLVSAHRRGPAS
jgi:hypothetical protein